MLGMKNQKIPFHLKSAILLVGICSCVLEENTDQIGEQLNLEEVDVMSTEAITEHGGVGGINSNDPATATVSADKYRGDFNGDGYADLAVGVPGEEMSGVRAGSVHVFYGTEEGITAEDDEIFSRATSDVEGTPETGDEFGRALAVGDFNGDGFSDLAIGAPFDDVNVDDAGSVTVLFGSQDGLSADDSLLLHQNTPGIEDDTDEGDNFGYALTAGDFNEDGRDDLAIGAPGEDVSGEKDAGVVHVIYGSQDTLSTMGSQIWHQGIAGITGLLEEGDRFGSVLEAGDFDGDASTEMKQVRDDLVIGVPEEDVGEREDAGWVHVLYGEPETDSTPPAPGTPPPPSGTVEGGLTAEGEQVWHQGISGIEDSPEDFDEFGFSLATGDFDDDGRDDLAIGVPGEEVDSEDRAGAVNVIYGSAMRLTATDDQLISQDSEGIEGEAEMDEEFGWSLVAGDFDDDGSDDLAIGAPGEDFGSIEAAGQVQVVYGESMEGLSGDRDQRIHQNIEGIEGVAEAQDRFGESLAMGDYDGDGAADLTIGVPFENVGAKTDAGAVHVIYGDDPEGLTAERDQVWHQDRPGVEGSAEADDLFGYDVM
jgi:hypothetical protein